MRHGRNADEIRVSGRSSMVERQLPKLHTRGSIPFASSSHIPGNRSLAAYPSLDAEKIELAPFTQKPFLRADAQGTVTNCPRARSSSRTAECLALGRRP